MIPSKAIKNEKIMETLMVQANSGMYRAHDNYFEECKAKLQKQDSRVSSDMWDSFDTNLWQKLGQEGDTPAGSAGNLHPGNAGSHASGFQPSTSEYQDRPIVGSDIFVEETLSITSKDIDEESEWSLDIPNSPN